MTMTETSGKILVLDSGVGGLAILNALQKKLPQESFIYFADYAFLPYGEKSQSAIQERCIEIVEHFLHKHPIKAVVLACNSATAAAISTLRERFQTEFFGIEPGIKPAAQQTEKGVLVLATKLTLASQQFNTLVETYAQGKSVVACATPELVEFVELGESSEKIQQHLNVIFKSIQQEFDVLLLGCTHFCFLRTELEKALGDKVHIVDTSEPLANRVCHRLKELNLQAIHSPDTQTDIFYSKPLQEGLQRQLQGRLEINRESATFTQLNL